MLLCDSFSLSKSRDRVVYTATEETVQKIRLQVSGDAVSAAVCAEPKQVAGKLQVRPGGWLQKGTDLHGEIRLLILILTRAEVMFSILVIRSCCGLGMLPGGMLPGVLGWSQLGTTGISEPGAAAQPQPNPLSSVWRWAVLSLEYLMGLSAKAGKDPLLKCALSLSNKKTLKLNPSRQGSPWAAVLGEGVLLSLSSAQAAPVWDLNTSASFICHFSTCTQLLQPGI